ncbi:MAG: hypothetical protein HQ483_18035 [Rhodospirillales bacterium]|nr:hypothetical protein [Rhodospirillales bacterium]
MHRIGGDGPLITVPEIPMSVLLAAAVFFLVAMPVGAGLSWPKTAVYCADGVGCSGFMA